MLKTASGFGSVFLLAPDGKTLEPVPFVRPGRTPTRAPLLFIHGIEFASPEESLEDLVWPILEALGPQRVADRSIYVFAWNSLLNNQVAIRDVIRNASLFDRLRLLFRELPRCRIYLKDVERRAKEAAHHLLPFVLDWGSENQMGPTVISHSMGSLVWAETLKLVLNSSQHLAKPGIWWALQPAMHRWSFADGGEYSVVPKLYTGADSARAVVWYSRLDFILSTIYLLSKRGFALGQYGCPVGTIPQKDVTQWVREAHGMRHLRTKWGHFFERIKPLIAEQADLFGI
jgi:hypothetical protein